MGYRFTGNLGVYGKTGKNQEEQLLFEVLDSLFPHEEHKDNLRPDWLRNSATGQNLEIDRYYPGLKLAFEWQGWYHYHAPEQIRRDPIKRRLCKKQGIVLVEIPARSTITKREVIKYIASARKIAKL